MKKSFVTKPVSILLSLLLALSVFSGVTFTAGAEDVVWTEVSSRNALAAAIVDGAHIRLSEDFTLSSRITIPADTSVTLDLNGHKLSRGLNESDSIAVPRGDALVVEGSLTIEDASGNNS